MYWQGLNLLALICLGFLTLTQGAPQDVSSARPKLKGYKMADLPGLSETEIDENMYELREVIRDYGPTALLVLNMTRYYRRGFQENMDNCKTSAERLVESKRRWSDLLDFFDQPGGMIHFKEFWWPHYEKPLTKKIRPTKATPNWEIFWNPDVLQKHYGLSQEGDSWEPGSALAKTVPPNMEKEFAAEEKRLEEKSKERRNRS